MSPGQDLVQRDASPSELERENQLQVKLGWFRQGWVGTPELFIVALLATLLGAYGARVTQVQNVGINMTVPAQPPVYERGIKYKTIGVVFFPNGNASLDASALANLNKWGLALRDCRDGHFVVNGSTSSAAFAKGASYSNMDLANDRAAAVVAKLKSLGVLGIESQNWKPEDDLLKVRTFNDHPSKLRNMRLEAAARRADIVFDELGSCRVSGQELGH